MSLVIERTRVIALALTSSCAASGCVYTRSIVEQETLRDVSIQHVDGAPDVVTTKTTTSQKADDETHPEPLLIGALVGGVVSLLVVGAALNNATEHLFDDWDGIHIDWTGGQR